MATAGAVVAGAACSTLALSVVLRPLHHYSLDEAFLGLNDLNAVAVSLLRAVGLVCTVTVATVVRHGE